MENNNDSRRTNLTLGEFDVKVILDCLDKQLTKELTDWGPVYDRDQNGYPYRERYMYRGLTKRGKQIQSTIRYIKSQIQ